MSVNAPMVVSDAPLDQKPRPQSWDNSVPSMAYYAGNEAQYHYATNPTATVAPMSYMPTNGMSPVQPVQSWHSGTYSPAYGIYNPAAFMRAPPPVPVQNQNWPLYYPYYSTQMHNGPTHVQGSYSVPVSPVAPQMPNLGSRDTHHLATQQKLKKPKPRDFSGLPRGPPRKPKQSGHAIWVGSLPLDTSIVALKDHFAEGFGLDIESVFVILKSNCAFINYSTEKICLEAVQKFHGSRFMGSILSCRIQKPLPSKSTSDSYGLEIQRTNSSSASGETLTSPASSVDSDSLSASVVQVQDDEIQAFDDKENDDKYFIIKSLSIQDLVLSVRYGVWTTQGHNEEALNKAYKAAKNVYLIFSANKSREYFGYARMISPVADNDTSILQALPPENPNVVDIPKSTITSASENAPAGRIFEDDFRGTLFWEAEIKIEDSDISTSPASNGDNERRFGGKPFGVAWLSTTRVPFTRTRGLRNAWNSSKEVKVARDGTELEPMVGKHLIGLFHDPYVKKQMQGY